MEHRMSTSKPLSTHDEWGGQPYKQMRHLDAMGKGPDLIQLGEWEKKGLVRKHLGGAFGDKIRGNAYACYMEKGLQWMALKYEWEVLGVRRSIATIPGKGYARTGPGWVGWLEFLPAAFEQELKLSFKMGVDASA